MPKTKDTRNLVSEITLLVELSSQILAQKLENHQSEAERISDLMGEPGDIQSGLEIACIVWLDALLMQNKISLSGRKLKPNMIAVRSLSECISSNESAYAAAIFTEWDKILADNYASVFAPAKSTIPTVLSNEDMSDVLSPLIEASEKIQKNNANETANIGGEIFARMMQAKRRKNTAAFYTRPEVAEFLAAALIPSEDMLPENWESWSLADFACGTGQLLRAGYRRLLHFAEKRNIDKADFHKHMVTENICGLDISPIAVHLSATAVINIFPEMSYDSMNIGVMDFGNKNGNIFAGSLELLSEEKNDKLFESNFTPMKGDAKHPSNLTAPDNSFMAVIMNPPYTRTRKGLSLGDLPDMSEKDRKSTQRRISKLRSSTYSHGQAGLASDFIALGDKKIREGGRLGYVLPLTFSAAGSWKGVRKRLEENFSDITVVFFSQGVKGGKDSLSDDTSIGEAMLLATKKTDGRKGVLYVSLNNVFSDADFSAAVGEKVWSIEKEINKNKTEGKLEIDGVEIGEWSYSAKTFGVWGAAGSKNLIGAASMAEKLCEGHIDTEDGIMFDITHLGDLFKQGSTHHNIGHPAVVKEKDGILRPGDPIGAFAWHEISTPDEENQHEDLSLWHAKAAKCLSVYVPPSHFGVEYDIEKAQQIREEKTDMFLKRHIGWPAQKVLVARTYKPTLGGVSWIGLQHDSEIVKFAFTVWANSIFGFITYWYQSQKQNAGRSLMQIRDAAKFRVPDFSSSEMEQRARKAYLEGDSNEMFSKLLDRANLCQSDSNREHFNSIAADILGIPARSQKRIISNMMNMWVAEPSVSPSGTKIRQPDFQI